MWVWSILIIVVTDGERELSSFMKASFSGRKSHQPTIANNVPNEKGAKRKQNYPESYRDWHFVVQ